MTISSCTVPVRLSVSRTCMSEIRKFGVELFKKVSSTSIEYSMCFIFGGHKKNYIKKFKKWNNAKVKGSWHYPHFWHTSLLAINRLASSVALFGFISALFLFQKAKLWACSRKKTFHAAKSTIKYLHFHKMVFRQNVYFFF